MMKDGDEALGKVASAKALILEEINKWDGHNYEMSHSGLGQKVIILNGMQCKNEKLFCRQCISAKEQAVKCYNAR